MANFIHEFYSLICVNHFLDSLCSLFQNILFFLKLIIRGSENIPDLVGVRFFVDYPLINQIINFFSYFFIRKLWVLQKVCQILRFKTLFQTLKASKLKLSLMISQEV